jgi:Tfp pilus assembly protein PilF
VNNCRYKVINLGIYKWSLYLSVGDYPQATALLTEVREAYFQLKDRRSYGSTLASLSLAYHYQGENEAAQQQAEAALAVAEERGNGSVLLLFFDLKRRMETAVLHPNLSTPNPHPVGL